MSLMSVVSPSMLIALALAAFGVDGSKKALNALIVPPYANGLMVFPDVR